jgi:hypothetical protein
MQALTAERTENSRRPPLIHASYRKGEQELQSYPTSLCVHTVRMNYSTASRQSAQSLACLSCLSMVRVSRIPSIELLAMPTSGPPSVTHLDSSWPSACPPGRPWTNPAAPYALIIETPTKLAMVVPATCLPRTCSCGRGELTLGIPRT